MKRAPQPPKNIKSHGTTAATEESLVVSTWTTAKRFKVVGTALVLVAFATQMYQTKSAAHEAEQMQAAELSSRSHSKGLEYETLYYAESAATGHGDVNSLKGAAEEEANGLSAMVVLSNRAKADKAAFRSNLLDMAAKVEGVESFRRFKNAASEQQNSIRPVEVNDMISVAARAQWLWWIYIGLYVIGSGCILRSQYLE